MSRSTIIFLGAGLSMFVALGVFAANENAIRAVGVSVDAREAATIHGADCFVNTGGMFQAACGAPHAVFNGAGAEVEPANTDESTNGGKLTTPKCACSDTATFNKISGNCNGS